MLKVSQFRQHAAECRMMAQRMAGEHRTMLLNMAASWDALAGRRERELLKRGLPIDHEGEITV
jgi:hypothetical protein